MAIDVRLVVSMARVSMTALLETYTYPTVDEAIGHILKLGKGALLAKVDIKRTYRNISIHPQDRYLLGMQWEGNLLIRYYRSALGQCPTFLRRWQIWQNG